MRVYELIELLQAMPDPNAAVRLAHWGSDSVFTPSKVRSGYSDPYGYAYSDMVSDEETEEHTIPVVVLEA